MSTSNIIVNEVPSPSIETPLLSSEVTTSVPLIKSIMKTSKTQKAQSPKSVSWTDTATGGSLYEIKSVPSK